MENLDIIKESARRLYIQLRNLREALLPLGEEREVLDELEEINKILYFYGIFSFAPLFTVVGPQGVGKSQMVNKLLNLKEEEALPVGEERCEKIPILLLPSKEEKMETEVYKWSSISEGETTEKKLALKVPIVSTSPLSYEEARKEAIAPSSDDVIIFWYIKNNPSLERISQLAVLPGFELKAPWEDAVRCILNISDVVIYTCDWRRKAQASSEKLEEWIKEADIPYEPILVFTKSDAMTEDQKENIKESTKSEVLFVGTGEDSEEEYENLWRKVSENLVNPSPRRRVFRFKNILSKIGRILNKIEKIAKRRESQEILTTSRVLEEYINFLDEEWEKATRTLVISRVESILQKRAEKSLNYAREVAEEEFGSFGQKVKLWFTGGPDVKKIIKIENTLKEKFLRGLDEEIVEEINKFAKLKVKEEKEKSETNWTFCTIAELLVAPIPKLEYKMNEMVEDIKKAGKLSKELTEFLTNRLEDTQKLAQTAEMVRGFLTSNKKGFLLPSLLSTGGGALTTAEITGVLPFTPAGAASIISAVVGGIVAAIGVLSIWSSILRTGRKMEWEIERWIREYTFQMNKAIKNNFIIKLDEYWEIIKFYIKKRLTELMGLDREVKDRIFLYTILNDIKEELINIEKKIL
ncbi:MAG: hypothetical protein ABIK72_00290 [candidate division WOR-3 bacterium]